MSTPPLTRQPRRNRENQGIGLASTMLFKTLRGAIRSYRHQYCIAGCYARGDQAWNTPISESGTRRRTPGGTLVANRGRACDILVMPDETRRKSESRRKNVPV